MKFQEAFKQMNNNGAVCIVDGSKYRIKDGKLQFFNTATQSWVVEWINSTTMYLMSLDWEVDEEYSDWNLANQDVLYSANEIHTGKYRHDIKKCRDLLLEDFQKPYHKEYAEEMIMKRFGDL